MVRDMVAQGDGSACGGASQWRRSRQRRKAFNAEDTEDAEEGWAENVPREEKSA